MTIKYKVKMMNRETTAVYLVFLQISAGLIVQDSNLKTHSNVFKHNIGFLFSGRLNRQAPIFLGALKAISIFLGRGEHM